jgi:hypothetical protein
MRFLSFITENLVLHDEEGERSFCLYWVRNLRGCSSLQKKSSSISIARRAMSSAGWGSSEPPNRQMRLKAKSPAERCKPCPSGRVAHFLSKLAIPISPPERAAISSKLSRTSIE